MFSGLGHMDVWVCVAILRNKRKYLPFCAKRKADRKNKTVKNDLKVTYRVSVGRPVSTDLFCACSVAGTHAQ